MALQDIPQDKLQEGHLWREWLFQVGAEIKKQQNLLSPPMYTTANAPPYREGAVYYDTTLHKLRVGGATGWETITSV